MTVINPAGRRNSSQLGMTFVYPDNTRRSISITTGISATGVQIASLRDAIAAASNAGVLEWRSTSVSLAQNLENIVTYDEAYDLGRSLVLVYINAGDREYVEVPAPDFSLQSLGVVDVGNALVQAIDAAFIAIYPNALLQSAFIATRKLARNRAALILPPPIEPPAGATPPALPGL